MLCGLCRRGKCSVVCAADGKVPSAVCRRRWGLSEKVAGLFGKTCSTFWKRMQHFPEKDMAFWEKAVRFFFCFPASFSGAGGGIFFPARWPGEAGGAGEWKIRPSRRGEADGGAGERQTPTPRGGGGGGVGGRGGGLPRGQVPAPDGAGEAHDSGRSTSTGFSFMAFRTCR